MKINILDYMKYICQSYTLGYNNELQCPKNRSLDPYNSQPIDLGIYLGNKRDDKSQTQ